MMHYRPETIRFSLEDTDKAAAMLLKGAGGPARQKQGP